MKVGALKIICQDYIMTSMDEIDYRYSFERLILSLVLQTKSGSSILKTHLPIQYTRICITSGNLLQKKKKKKLWAHVLGFIYWQL